jgi:hypothetical protein
MVMGNDFSSRKFGIKKLSWSLRRVSNYTCCHSPYATSSLTRGWFFRLQLLPVPPAQSFSDPKTAGLTITFYFLRFETPATWRARSQYLYLPGTGWPSYTPRHYVPFSFPPTTRRATVEVLEPASTRRPNSNKDSVRTSEKTPHLRSKAQSVNAARETIVVYCENLTHK